MSHRSSESDGVTVVLDSHIHFWDTRRLDYPWLRAFPRLDRPFLPGDLDVGDIQVEAMVFVQANPSWSQVEDETTWAIGLGRTTAASKGWWPASLSTADPQSSRSGSNASRRRHGVAGVRQLIQDEPEGFAVEQEFVDAVRLAGTHGFVVDLCVRSQQIAEVTQLVERCPEVTFVLDHLGKPDIRSGESAEWVEHISRLAKHTNVLLQAVRSDV